MNNTLEQSVPVCASGDAGLIKMAGNISKIPEIFEDNIYKIEEYLSEHSCLQTSNHSAHSITYKVFEKGSDPCRIPENYLVFRCCRSIYTDRCRHVLLVL